jgi:hypothetical protein
LVNRVNPQQIRITISASSLLLTIATFPQVWPVFVS